MVEKKIKKTVFLFLFLFLFLTDFSEVKAESSPMVILKNARNIKENSANVEVDIRDVGENNRGWMQLEYGLDTNFAHKLIIFNRILREGRFDLVLWKLRPCSSYYYRLCYKNNHLKKCTSYKSFKTKCSSSTPFSPETLSKRVPSKKSSPQKISFNSILSSKLKPKVIEETSPKVVHKNNSPLNNSQQPSKKTKEVLNPSTAKASIKQRIWSYFPFSLLLSIFLIVIWKSVNFAFSFLIQKRGEKLFQQQSKKNLINSLKKVKKEGVFLEENP